MSSEINTPQLKALLQAAHLKGFLCATEWANRGELVDLNRSPALQKAYDKDCEKDLAEIELDDKTYDVAEADAFNMGANRGSPSERERRLFEAWMQGHCWKIRGDWTGSTYVAASELNGGIDFRAMQTRQLWAAWRDRANLGRIGFVAAQKSWQSTTPP